MPHPNPPLTGLPLAAALWTAGLAASQLANLLRVQLEYERLKLQQRKA